MDIRRTLLTAHKGVDLHAATALAVMREQLGGGQHLKNLLRCEVEEFLGSEDLADSQSLLASSKFYNPNKHHYGVFQRQGEPLTNLVRDNRKLPEDWPGPGLGSDLGQGEDWYQQLLGGALPPGSVAVDIVTWIKGQPGHSITGVLWRLVLEVDKERAGELGMQLSVTRSRTQGLLLNPHLEDWLLAVR